MIISCADCPQSMNTMGVALPVAATSLGWSPVGHTDPPEAYCCPACSKLSWRDRFHRTTSPQVSP